MSVIAEISIFPVDQGESLSPFVARALRAIQASGLPHVLGPMGTCVEGELDQVLEVMRACHAALEPDCARIVMTVKLDSRKGPGGRLDRKLASVRAKLD
jgi:uncharacterized protein (TIGR00106 family)